MLIESMSLRSKSGVSASRRTPCCLSSRRLTKSRSRSSSGSDTASPPGLQAIRHHATVVFADIRRRLGAVEIHRVEVLWIAELLGEVLQHAEDADHQRIPGLFRRADQQLKCGLPGDGGLGIVARLPGRIELAQSVVALVDDLREAVGAGGPGDEMDDPARLKLVQKVVDEGGGESGSSWRRPALTNGR